MKDKNQKPQWTILCVNEKGESKTMPHYKRWVTISVWIIILLGGAAAGLGLWLKKALDNQRLLHAQLQDRDTEIKQISEAKELLLARVFRVEKELAEAKKKADSVSNDVKSNNTGASHAKETLEDQTDASIPASVSRAAVEAFELTHSSSNSVFTVSFRVRNTGSKKEPLAGYCFVILKHQQSNPKDWVSLPAAALRSGKPLDYKKGSYFSAVNYKDFQLRISDDINLSSFNTATLLVYDPNGKALFEENMPIELPAINDARPSEKTSSSKRQQRTSDWVQKKESAGKKVLPAKNAAASQGGQPIENVTDLKTTWPESHPYSIHVFSYQDQRQAQSQAQILRKQGYESFITPVSVPGKGYFYRIFIGQYKNSHLAEIAKEKISGQKGFGKDIHIMKRQWALSYMPINRQHHN
jgi:cell division septation protein DedD